MHSEITRLLANCRYIRLLFRNLVDDKYVAF